MSNLLRIAASLASVLALLSSGLAVAQNWAAAKLVKYRVEGVHNGREAVVYGDYEGKADVIDRITVEFSWDTKKRKIIGPVTLTDGKSELSNVKSDCPPPQLKGAYEHFQSVSHSMISGDQIQIKGIRTHAPASVSNYPGSCSMRAIPGGTEEAHLWVGGIDPQILGIANSPGSPVSIAADSKSFSMMAADNWVWTYTPTLSQSSFYPLEGADDKARRMGV
jgi:hypothetical protein